jgi:hypothetical protein
VGGLGQLFCFPRKIVEFPIHFCLVYIVACQNATILLAGVGGPRDPTIARGTIRSLLKQLELADNARHMTTRRVHPAVTFFGTLISRSFSFVCVVSQSIFSLSFQDSFFCLSFHFQFSFGFVRVFFCRDCASHFGAAGTTHVGP